MTDNATTTNTTDLPPYYADLGSDGPYRRAVAATVAAGLLAQIRPFKNSASLFGSSSTAAPAIEPTDVTMAVVDLAEWITTGLHPLTAWADGTDDEEAVEDDADLEDVADDVDMKDPEWRP